MVNAYSATATETSVVRPMSNVHSDEQPTRDASPPMQQGTQSTSHTTLANLSTTKFARLKSIIYEHRTVIAASCAAVSSVSCGFPFDSIKTRMQTHSYRSLGDCIRKTYRAEGIRGFFRGILPPLLTVSAIRATSFSIYEGTKQHMREFGWQTDKIWSLGAGSFLAGGASGLAIAALSCPFELVKIHRQLQVLFWQRQDKELRRTIMDANTTPEARRLAEQARQRLVDPRTLPTWASVREIVQLRGPLGLFYGLRSHLMRDLAGTGTYFAGYECLKRTLASLESGEHPSAGVHFLAGGLAGVFCWILTFPLDLVKSIIQKDVTSVTSIEANGVTTVHPKLARAPSGWRVARDIWRRAGVRGLYNGISVTLIRAFPIHALNFTVYEYVTNRIQELTRE